MSQRIQALAEQAGLLYPQCGPTVDTRHQRKKRESIEKFAELIIQECCDWIDGSPANDAGQLHLTKSFIIANLKGMFRSKE